MSTPFVPRTVMFMRVLEAFNMTIQDGSSARPFVPRTTILVCVLQAIDVTVLGRALARPSVRPTDTYSHVRI